MDLLTSYRNESLERLKEDADSQCKEENSIEEGTQQVRARPPERQFLRRVGPLGNLSRRGERACPEARYLGSLENGTLKATNATMNPTRSFNYVRFSCWTTRNASRWVGLLRSEKRRRPGRENQCRSPLCKRSARHRCRRFAESSLTCNFRAEEGKGYGNDDEQSPRFGELESRHHAHVSLRKEYSIGAGCWVLGGA